MKSFRLFIIQNPLDVKPIQSIYSKFDRNDVTSITSQNFDDLKSNIPDIIHSHLIITTGNWFESSECNDLVQIARILGKEIIHETKWKSYDRTIND